MTTIMIITVIILFILFIIGVFAGNKGRIIARIFEILIGLLFIEAIIWAILWTVNKI